MRDQTTSPFIASRTHCPFMPSKPPSFARNDWDRRFGQTESWSSGDLVAPLYGAKAPSYQAKSNRTALVPSDVLLLVVRPEAPSSVLAPSSDALCS